MLMQRKYHIYVDKKVLMDDACLSMFEELAAKHRVMYLYLHDIWELEEVKKLEQYEYICDVVYGISMESAVQSNVISKGQNVKQVLLLHSGEGVYHKPFDMVGINHEGSVDLNRFLEEKSKEIKHKRRIVLSILALCILYFIVYFLNLDSMPPFMVDGWIAFLFALIPAQVFIITLFYGLYCGAISWSFLGELLDLV